jgi:hypothetical protein
VAGADPGQGRPRAAGRDQGGGAGPVPPRGHPGPARAGRLLRLSGFFAVVFILFTRDNQRLGDLVAGTLVLRERSALAAPAPVSFAPPPGLEHYTATLDRAGLGTEEYQAVRTFLLRAASLPPGPARPWPCSWPTRWRPGCARRPRPGSPRALPPVRGRRLPAAPAPAPPGPGRGSVDRRPAGTGGAPGSAGLPSGGPSPGRVAAHAAARTPPGGAAPPRDGATGGPAPVEPAGSRRPGPWIRCPRSRSGGSSPGRRSGCRSRCPWWPA